MLDWTIRNAKVVDGTGSPWFRADVGIEGDRIAAVGRIPEGRGEREIDATGHVLSPGFIDIHTHSDLPFVVDPRAESKIRQGVTTEVIGNCGFSAAPLVGDMVDQMRRRLATYDPPFELEWATADEYLSKLERQGIGINCVALAGHGALRTGVMGVKDERPTADELVAMKRLLREAMDAGAIGISTGLIYPPSSYARTDEIVELARVASERGGLYFTHVRGDGPSATEGIREAIEIARRAELPGQIAHMHGVYEDALIVEEARREGVDVTYDQYPYTAGSGPLKTLIPSWAHEGGNDAIVSRLSDPGTRRKIRDEMVAGTVVGEIDWSKIVICKVVTQANLRYEGLSMDRISDEMHRDPFDALFDLLIEERADVGMIKFGQSEEGVRRVMGLSGYMVGSDGSSLATDGPLSAGKPHPRSYGTFPRILGVYVREERVVTLETAIRQMTSAPANRLGLTHRGVIRPGMYADLVLFDETRVADTATYQDPHRYPIGIDCVMVNGRMAVEGGERPDVLAGRVLRGRG